MVSGDNFSDGVVRTRPALSDVTNRPEKRPFSSISSGSGPESGSGYRKVDAKQARFQGRFAAGGASQDGLATTDRDSENEERDEGVRKVEWSGVSGSRDSKFLGLERCVRLKDDDGENSIGDDEDLLKGCSCAFCSTAAYIWSDLHYQDIKARLSALKKSQKEAGMLVQKISGAKDNAIHSQRNSAESLGLELNLMDQWRSLFAHMENTLVHESSQLELSFERLKEMRESCKNDLEMINKGRLHNH
ncbi:putative Tether containing UBX domain for GLUT4 [Senna tora]|uniref:Putative Tether containing UBX domain for GLUT4 n=1 Tax=Senna tora TaxID=362788 RepID=A0A834WXD8_9FABA|nr:putative Tether containing UBX domain for GLUT4 [Senna tora]